MNDDDDFRDYLARQFPAIGYTSRRTDSLSNWQIAALILCGLLVVLLAMSTDTIV